MVRLRSVGARFDSERKHNSNQLTLLGWLILDSLSQVSVFSLKSSQSIPARANINER